MSDTAIATAPQEPVIDGIVEAPKPKKVFSRKSAIKFVPVALVLPFIYEDYEPWTFKLRLKLSKDAEERRQKFAIMPPSKKLAQMEERNLDELCDLLIELPGGFSDLTEVTGQAPGVTFKNYVMTTSDPEAKSTLFQIVGAALDVYWGKIMPHEFRTPIQDSE